MTIDRNPFENHWLGKLDSQRRVRATTKSSRHGWPADDRYDPRHLVPRKPPDDACGYNSPSIQKPSQQKAPTMPFVTCKAMKVVAIIDGTTIANLEAPEGGQARLVLSVRYGPQTYTVDLKAVAIRKAQATLDTLGIENSVVLLQGRLEAMRLSECGLVVQPRVKKAEVEAATA